jgi:hypothetical protein
VVVLALAAAVAAVAVSRELLRPLSGAALAVAALLALAAVGRRRAVSWGTCAGVTFAVLLAAVLHLHAAYSRQFALPGRLRTDPALAREPALPVVCYPHRWDSVSFYLPKADVRVYGAAQQRELADDLRSRPRTLVLVKTGPALQEFLRALPGSAEWLPQEATGTVTAGWVRLRPQAPDFLLARGD